MVSFTQQTATLKTNSEFTSVEGYAFLPSTGMLMQLVIVPQMEDVPADEFTEGAFQNESGEWVVSSDVPAIEPVLSLYVQKGVTPTEKNLSTKGLILAVGMPTTLPTDPEKRQKAQEKFGNGGNLLYLEGAKTAIGAIAAALDGGYEPARLVDGNLIYGNWINVTSEKGANGVPKYSAVVLSDKIVAQRLKAAGIQQVQNVNIPVQSDGTILTLKEAAALITENARKRIPANAPVGDSAADKF